jgi:His-Xaa-Ser system protein HxsD
MIQREVSLDATAYSADAIQRAAYRFCDRLSLELTTVEGTFRCVVHVETDDDDMADATISDFRNEVLDQTLRERIRTETEDVRNLSLALAFSNTDLVSDG